MEAAYLQTYFLAQTLADVGSDPDALIYEGLSGQEFVAPTVLKSIRDPALGLPWIDGVPSGPAAHVLARSNRPSKLS